MAEDTEPNRAKQLDDPEPPKRRPGRHPADCDCGMTGSDGRVHDGTGTPARSRASSGARQSRRANNVATDLHSAITVANVLFVQGCVTGVLPQAMIADALTDEEIDKLSKAAAEALKANPRALKWLERAAKVGPNMQLAFVVSQIAFVRMVNHGLVPGLSASAPDSVETRGAYGDYRQYGNGQDDPSIPVAAMP